MRILFLVGLFAVLFAAHFFSKKVTEGDRFEEETTEERLYHLEDRLRTHRRWWQRMIITGALVLYVSVVALGFVQSTSIRVEEEGEARVRQAVLDDLESERNRIEDTCRFRDFVEEFFAELSSDRFQVSEVEDLEGYSNLEPGAREFIDSLADALDLQAIAVEEARREYIEQFPQENC